MWVGDERWCPRIVTGEKGMRGVIGVVGDWIEVVGGEGLKIVGVVALSRAAGVKKDGEEGGEGAAITHTIPLSSTELLKLGESVDLVGGGGI